MEVDPVELVRSGYNAISFDYRGDDDPGQDAWTGTEDNWLGGPAAMWWSQADAATYRTWLTQAGLEVTSQQFVPEGDSGHALFWAWHKPADSPSGQLAGNRCRGDLSPTSHRWPNGSMNPPCR